MSQTPYRLVETAAPEAEPVDLEELKAYLRVDHDADDDLLDTFIAAAREYAEIACGRSFIERGYSLFLDAWPESRALTLPRPPLLEVTAINIYEENNTSAEFSDDYYFVDAMGAPGRVVLSSSAAAPTPGRDVNGIEVQFTAGYGDVATDVPAQLRAAMMQVAAFMYENRGANATQAALAAGVSSVFSAYRTVSIA